MDSRFFTTLAGENLQDWYSIEIETDALTQTKHVFFHSRIHTNKRMGFSFCFSTSFSDYEILNDRTLISRIYEMYGADIYKKAPHN